MMPIIEQRYKSIEERRGSDIYLAQSRKTSPFEIKLAKNVQNNNKVKKFVPVQRSIRAGFYKNSGSIGNII